jgi:hypothetical protein
VVLSVQIDVTLIQQSPVGDRRSTFRLAIDRSTTFIRRTQHATTRIAGHNMRASVGYVRFFGEADSDAFRLSLGAAFRF